MNSFALRNSNRLPRHQAGIAPHRMLLIAAMLSLVACAQTPPVAEPAPAPMPVSEAAEATPATVSIRDAEGTPIPESDPAPAPAPMSMAATASAMVNGPSPSAADNFICMPANEAKAKSAQQPKAARKPRSINRQPVEKKAPAISATLPPPGSKLDNVRAIEPGDVVSLLGKKVWGPTGDDMGRIVDLLVEPSGQIRSAVIDFGGFLGVGNRKIAVNWSLLKLHSGSEGKQVVLTLDRDQVLAAPEYKDPAHPAEVVAPTPPHGG